MLVYVIIGSEKDPVNTIDRISARLREVKFDTVLAAPGEKYAELAKMAASINVGDAKIEICDILAGPADRDAEFAAARAVEADLVRRTAENSCIAVIPEPGFYSRVLGAAFMHISDERLKAGIEYTCDEGSISVFSFSRDGKRTSADVINDTMHMRITDPGNIPPIKC